MRSQQQVVLTGNLVPVMFGLWPDARALALAWRDGSEIDSTRVADAARCSVDSVVRLPAVNQTLASARCLWLLSLELDEALERSVSAESDDAAAETARTAVALTDLVRSWRRRAQGNSESASIIIFRAAGEVLELLFAWS